MTSLRTRLTTISSFSAEEYFYFITLMLAAAIPFPMIITSSLTGILLLLWLVRAIKNRSVTFFRKPWFWLFSSLFFLGVIGLIHSHNLEKGLFNVEKTLSFLIFPIVFFDVDIINEKRLKTILITFAVSCTIAAIICLMGSTVAYLHSDEEISLSKVFSYHILSERIGLHAMYMSMYICFSIFCLVKYGLLERSLLRKHPWIRVAWILFLVIFLFLLSTRIFLLIFFLLSMVTIIVFIRQNPSNRKTGLYAIGLGVILVILLFSVPKNRERIYEAINFSESIDLSSENSLNRTWGGRALRIAIWKCSWKVIQKQPFFGVGNGDAQEALQKSYAENNFGFAAYYNSYNAHNQYLQHTITFGIFGLLLLLIHLGLPLWTALKQKDEIYLYFLSIVIMAALTEVFLARNKGIVFYGLFSSVLGSYLNNKVQNHAGDEMVM